MMLAPSVRALIAGSIHSMAALELLLLLHRSPDTYWSAVAAAAALGAPEEPISNVLRSFVRDALVVQARDSIAFRYAPVADEDRLAADALAVAYEQQRLAVLEAVYASGSASIDAFADAFRLRRR